MTVKSPLPPAPTALRGKLPEKADKRLKCMLFGEAGVGKTTAAIQFPKPYLIDTEKGATNDGYVDMIRDRGGATFQTTDFEEMIKEVHTLMTVDHPYQTIIIDPITVVYANLLDASARSLADSKDPEGTAFGRHYVKADRRMKHLLNLLLRVDMNVVVTCHAKMVYGDGMAKLGNTFDGYKKLDYLFDLVLELQKRGKDRYGVVKKTRIATFCDGDAFPFTYNALADRYGRESLERKVVSEVLATQDQVEEITRLVALLKIDEETVDKWLGKANAETFAEMNTTTIAKCIEHCQKLVNKPAPEKKD